jgi:hemolysin III
MDSIGVFPIPGCRAPVSCLTHLSAAPVFAVLGYFLVQQGRGHWARTISLTVLVVSTVFLLSISGVYHLLGPGTGRNVMRQLDVAAIFALIAGTVTPVPAILFRGFNRWAPLILVWFAAAMGITLMSIFGENLPPEFGTATFLVLGWGGLISCILLWKRYGFFVRESIAVGRCRIHAGSWRPDVELADTDPRRHQSARVVALRCTHWPGTALEVRLRIRRRTARRQREVDSSHREPCCSRV